MFSKVLTAAVLASAVTAMPQTPKTSSTTKPPAPFQDPSGLGNMLGDILGANGGAIPFGPKSSGCAKHEILIARGTGEPGPFGVVVGDPLVSAVKAVVPGIREYAVQYPASFDLSTSPNIGADDVINRLNQQHKDCPDETFALVGYSQGAGVIHAAFSTNLIPYPGQKTRPKLDPAVLDKIKAVVLFGDPGNKGTEGPAGTFVPQFPQILQDRLRENCAPNDPACDPKGADFAQHLTYIQTKYQQPSAEYIEAAFTSKPLPKAPKTAADMPHQGP